jgi:eukaryotic-like serine/threonine-protein kinase
MGRDEDSQFPSDVFVGREAELAELRASVDKALHGIGQLFLISGESGIGKTRLAHELSWHAHSYGARVIWGRCWEGSGSPAYWPWIQVVRSCLEALGEERLDLLINSEARQVADLLPEVSQTRRLSTAATSLRALPSSDPEEARFRLFDSTARLLKSAASAEPLVLVFDDLQEADHPSLLMLRFVARELKEARIVILGNYREAEVRAAPALHRLLGEIAREGHQLALRGLNEAQVARFVYERAGQAAEPGLVNAIMRATAGNPLFLDGVIRMLCAEGKVTNGNRPTIEDLKIPDSVREAIRQRLGLFSQRARALLSIASVVGQEFEFECLRRVFGDPFDSLVEALGEIQRDGIFNSVDIGHRRYRFSHDLIRETLYEDLPSTSRLHLHQQVAEALEEIYTYDTAPHLAELAHHYRMAAPAGTSAKAIDYSIRAGEEALAIFAYEEAAIHWQAALEILEQRGEADVRNADLCLRLGRLMGTIDRAKGIKYLEKALGLYKQLGHRIMIAQTHTSLGNFRCMIGTEMDVPDAIEHYRKAEAVLRFGKQDDSSLRLSAYVNCGLAAAAARAAHIQEGLAAARRAVDIAERLGDEKIIARAVTQFSQHLYYSGRLAEAFTLIDRAWEIADRINDAKIAFAVTRTGGGCSAALGDPRAYRWYERELSKPRTANTRHARAVLSAVLGECFLLTGQAERVSALMAQMLTYPSNQSQGYVAFVQGQWEEAERCWRQTYERSRQVGGRDEVYGYPVWLAGVLRILGKHNETEAFLTEALSICSEEPFEWVEMWARPELALVFVETGRAKHAEQHLTRCREIWLPGKIGVA